MFGNISGNDLEDSKTQSQFVQLQMEEEDDDEEEKEEKLTQIDSETQPE